MAEKVNFSVFVIGGIFILFMLFILFRPDLNEGMVKNIEAVTGRVVLDVSSIGEAWATGSTIKGNLGVNIGSGEFVENTTSFKLQLSDAGGAVKNASTKTADEILNLTIGLFKVNKSRDIYGYNQSGNYNFEASVFGLSYNEAGNYNLNFSLVDKNGGILNSSSKSISIVAGETKIDVVGDVFITVVSERNETSIIDISDELKFKNGNEIVCFGNFSNQELSDVKVNIYFSAPGVREAVAKYENIGQGIFEDIKVGGSTCEGTLCIASYEVEITRMGNWSCLIEVKSKEGIDRKISEDVLIMINSAPELRKELPGNISITKEGKYENEIDLDDYFKDADGHELSYQTTGQKYIGVMISDNGDVFFSNTQKFEGAEIVQFVSSDGFDRTFSNNVTIIVGTGFGLLCTPFWDCSGWTECVNNAQTRTCVDRNMCGVTEGRPPLRQYCEARAAASRTEIIPVKGEIEISKGLLGSPGRVVLFVFALLIMVGVIGAGIFLFLRAKKERESSMAGVGEKTGGREGKARVTGVSIARPAEAKVVNITEAEKYVEGALGAGQNAEKIKKDLVGAGWPQEIVNKAIQIGGLREFVREKLKQGFDREKIRNSLVAKGWKKEIVDEVFAGVS